MLSCGQRRVRSVARIAGHPSSRNWVVFDIRPVGANLLAISLAQSFHLLISFDPAATDPEIPHHRAESPEDEKQTQGSEKHGEGHNEI